MLHLEIGTEWFRMRRLICNGRAGRNALIWHSGSVGLINLDVCQVDAAAVLIHGVPTGVPMSRYKNKRLTAIKP